MGYAPILRLAEIVQQRLKRQYELYAHTAFSQER